MPENGPAFSPSAPESAVVLLVLPYGGDAEAGGQQRVEAKNAEHGGGGGDRDVVPLEVNSGIRRRIKIQGHAIKALP
jgi:hypothetical protein